MRNRSSDYSRKNLLVTSFIAIILVLCAIGWMLNLVELFGADFSTITGELVIRVIGVFIAPIGVVMGVI